MPDLIDCSERIAGVKRGIWQPFNNVRYQTPDLKPRSQSRYLTKPSIGVI
jgi:hypothetical protein